MKELMQPYEKIEKNKAPSKAQQRNVARVSHLSLRDCKRRENCLVVGKSGKVPTVVTIC
jgi:hypothetical protein